MTFDVTLNLSVFQKGIEGKLEGESNNLSEVT